MVEDGLNLNEAHVKAFVAPGKFARMLFHFEDESLIEASEEYYK